MTRNTIGGVSLALLTFLANATAAFAGTDEPIAPTASSVTAPIAAPNAAPQVSLPIKMLNQPFSPPAPGTATVPASDWKALRGEPTIAVAPAPAPQPANTYSAAKPALATDKQNVATDAVAATKAVSMPAAPTAKPAVAAPAKPQTTLAIDIDLSRQRMTLTESGQLVGSWAISSGREGYRSPTGTFRPLWSSKMWFSKKYDNAPMPNAVFFSGGVAMHATQATGMLGQPASHGCIRQSPTNAATTYRLVAKHGNSHTKITVHGTPHDSEPRVAIRDKSHAAVRFASQQSRILDRHVQMRRVILVDGAGNRRIAEIPANDPRLMAYQNRHQGSDSIWR